MTDLNIVLHSRTELAIKQFLARPAHGLLLTGASGSGKSTIAYAIASALLGIANPDATPDVFENQPHVRIIRPIDNKAIPIESIRELQHFLGLKVPADPAPHFRRIILIEQAQMLTTEAQNALLKTIEEPPLDTAVILTAPSADAMLPTIQSRVRELAIILPSAAELTDYFSDRGFSAAAIKQALLLSGDLPGLASALLDDDEEHPLVVATTHARGVLQSKSYERLLLVDSLSKQRELCVDILYVLGQMARTALRSATTPAAAQRWQRVMQATYTASEQLSRNVQAKLVLTNLMLVL